MKMQKPNYLFHKVVMPVIMLVMCFSCKPVDPELSSDKTITEFSFRTANNPGLSTDFYGSIVGENIHFTFPAGTALNALKPTIIHTGNSISPLSGTAMDFTDPVAYTVTAMDESIKAYEITVTVTPPVLSSNKTISSVSFLKEDNPALPDNIQGTINGLNILFTVPSGISVAALKPTIIHTGSSINPASGTANNFTTPATYTVTAADGTTENYTLSVTVADSGPSVYVVGAQNFFGTNQVMVWKNGVGTTITNGTYNSGATAVFVKGNTLFVAGSQSIGRSYASFWKIENGMELPTYGLNETPNDAYTNSIYISETNDEYIAGSENHGANIGTIAKVWKNGVATHLSTMAGGAFSVFVSGQDVYTAGWESTATGYVAKVWKNGITTTLSPENGKAYGKAVFVSSGIAYVAGQTWNAVDFKWIITVWKDGVPEVINNSGSAEVNAMFIYDQDVYIVGNEVRNNVYNAKIWKNGVGTFLSSNAGSEPKSVYVYNGDVYVAGWEYDIDGKQVAMLWKNGVGTPLATNAYATGVMVK